MARKVCSTLPGLAGLRTPPGSQKYVNTPQRKTVTRAPALRRLEPSLSSGPLSSPRRGGLGRLVPFGAFVALLVDFSLIKTPEMRPWQRFAGLDQGRAGV
jgi:hypothetical protein